MLRKELLDYRRDRGALLIRLCAILIVTVLVAIPGYVAPRQALQAYMQPVPLAVAGADRAPSLMAYLVEHQIVVQPPPDDPIAAVRGGSVDLVLLVPPNYQEALASGRPATMRLLERSGRDDAQRTSQYVAGVLANYSAELRLGRLVARGLDPALAIGLQVAREEVAATEGPSTAQRILALILGTWGIAMVCMTGGPLATQATAGERERRTLEPLLCETIDRAALVIGKSGAALVFGLVAGWLILLSAGVVWVVSPYRVLLGIPTPSTLLGTAAALLVAGPPLAVLATLLAALKGSADAATGRQLLLALLATGFVTLVLQNDPQGLLIYATPVLGPLALVSEVLLGQPPSLPGLALAIASGVLTSVLLVWFTTRLFEREAFLVG